MAEKQDPQYEAALREQSKQQQDLDRAQKTLRRNAIDSVDRVTELIDGYEKLSKAMDLGKLGSQVTKLEAAAKKQKATMKLLERFADYAPVYVSKMITGGLSPKELDGIIKMVTAAGKAKGKSSNLISEDIKSTIDKIKALQDKINRAILDGNKDALKEYQKQAESVIGEVEDNTKALMEASTQQLVSLRQTNDAVQKKIDKFVAEGKTNSLKYKLLMMSEAAGGKGIAGTAIEKLLAKEKSGSLGGEISKKMGLGETAQKFVTEDGKYSHAKAATYFAEGAVDRAKQGYDMYKATGRQFGMEHTKSEVYGAYENTRRKLAKTAISTGHSQEEVAEVWKTTANAIQDGNKNLEARAELQRKITDETITMSDVLGTSSTKISSVLSGMRKNLGFSPQDLSAGIKDIHKNLLDINGTVDENHKLVDEDMVSAYEEVANKVENAGVNMKKFGKYTAEAYAQAVKMGGAYATNLKLAKMAADLRAGVTGSNAGNIGLLATSGQLSLSSKSKEGQALGEALKDKTFEEGKELLAENLKKMGKNQTEIAQMTSGLDKEAYDALVATLTGNSGMQALSATNMGGADYSKFLVQAKNSGLFETLSVTDNKNKEVDPYKAMEELSKQLGSGGGAAGANALMRQLGMSREDITAFAMSRAKSKLNEVKQSKAEEELKKQGQNAAQMGNAVDPMKIFKDAVDIFSGSVTVFAVAAGVSTGVDIIKQAMAIKSAGGLGNYLKGGTPGSGGLVGAPKPSTALPEGISGARTGAAPTAEAIANAESRGLEILESSGNAAGRKAGILQRMKGWFRKAPSVEGAAAEAGAGSKLGVMGKGLIAPEGFAIAGYAGFASSVMNEGVIKTKAQLDAERLQREKEHLDIMMGRGKEKGFFAQTMGALNLGFDLMSSISDVFAGVAGESALGQMQDSNNPLNSVLPSNTPTTAGTTPAQVQADGTILFPGYTLSPKDMEKAKTTFATNNVRGFQA